MTDSIYERVVRWLQTTDVPLPKVAEGSGVPLSTIKRIRSQRTKDPSVHAIEDLDRFRESVQRIAS